MAGKKGTDGGYYAILGFEYQFDATLLKAFEKNQEVHLENLEDFSTIEGIFQVKYRGKSKFSLPSVKKTIKELIKVHLKTQLPICLYAHFSDRDEQVWQPELSDLLRLFRSDYTEEEIKKFHSAFHVNFSIPYFDHHERLLAVIKARYHCPTNEVAELCYGSVVDFLKQVVLKNSPKERKCTTEAVDAALKSKLSHYAKHHYINLLERATKHKALRGKYFTSLNVGSRVDRIFVMNFSAYGEFETKQVVEKIIKNWSKTSSRQVPKIVPYLFLSNCTPESLGRLKSHLFRAGITFHEGYPFHGAEFDVEYFTAEMRHPDEFRIRLLTTEEEFNLLAQYLQSRRAVEIYHFYDSIPAALPAVDCQQVSMNVDGLTDILNII